MTDTREKTEITLLIDRETDLYLSRLANKLGRDKSDVANEALLEWFEDLEDIAEAQRVLAENNPSSPAEEVWKRLGLED
jgi:predicted DNA-binding protein